MAVKIRLMRIGTNRQPFYRVVAVDERKKRTGGYLELLGTYNPLTQPKEINLDQGKIDAWIKKGAVLSHGFLRIIGKAPQRLPRKAKKEPKLQKETQPKAAQEAVSENSENSDKPEDQKTSESETAISDNSDQSDKSDNAGSPSSSESSETSTKPEQKP